MADPNVSAEGGMPADEAEGLAVPSMRSASPVPGEAVPTGERLSAEDSAKVLKAQRARANLMAIGLFCLCILFFMITIVKIGLWG